jgi:hypothetical protein
MTDPRKTMESMVNDYQGYKMSAEEVVAFAKRSIREGKMTMGQAIMCGIKNKAEKEPLSVAEGFRRATSGAIEAAYKDQAYENLTAATLPGTSSADALKNHVVRKTHALFEDGAPLMSQTEFRADAKKIYRNTYFPGGPADYAAEQAARIRSEHFKDRTPRGTYNLELERYSQEQEGQDISFIGEAIKDRGFVLEKAGSSWLHYAVEELTKRGRGSHSIFAEMAKMFQTFVVQHDWAAAFKHAENIGDGDVRLPFEHNAFEFKISGFHVIAMLGPVEGVPAPAGIILAGVNGRWYCPQGKVAWVDGRLKDHGERGVALHEPDSGRDLLDFLSCQQARTKDCKNQ